MSLASFGQFIAFTVDVILRLPSACRRPADLAWQCYRLGLGSLPLVAAAALSIGVVSWLQTRSLLANFGSETLLPGFIAVFVLVGLGPVVTALVVAGQAGAQLGAELGSMKITEQVDALEAMGLSRVEHLAATRVLAVTLMLPLLTLTLDAVALTGAWAAEAAGGGVSLQQYVNESHRFLTLSTVLPATASSVVFGFLIGVTGCWCGLEAGLGTSGVGRASTASVVTAMLAVLTANVLWVRATSLLFG